MALKAGIVGLPNVGKSTLFNALTKAGALAANYPFATKDPNVGVINVPDERLDKLTELVNPQKTIPTSVEIVDIAGLIKGASKGEGLGNQFLANIREVDAIVHVVRCFDNGNVVHVDGDVNPVRDKEVIDTELQLKDLETVEKRMEKQKRAAKGNDKEEVKKLDVLKKIAASLEQGKNAREIEFAEDELEFVKELTLLTTKPILYVCNVDENSVKSGNAYTAALTEAVANEDAEVVKISAEIESEIAQLDTLEDQLMFLEEMGLEEPGVNVLIAGTYKLLNLITYFTAGEKEVRAWTIQRGWKAPQAAGVIHTDFEKGFIRAEVIDFSTYVELGSESAVKSAGKLRVEGKEYVVDDGDVMHFLFNV
ncbi:MAG: redox-regulated ATPase YchF [Saprospiraceae bacterium]|nr:redox-regulated ATPase YchF [Saprospiraceae bacterium]